MHKSLGLFLGIFPLFNYTGYTATFTAAPNHPRSLFGEPFCGQNFATFPRAAVRWSFLFFSSERGVSDDGKADRLFPEFALTLPLSFAPGIDAQWQWRQDRLGYAAPGHRTFAYCDFVRQDRYPGRERSQDPKEKLFS